MWESAPKKYAGLLYRNEFLYTGESVGGFSICSRFFFMTLLYSSLLEGERTSGTNQLIFTYFQCPLLMPTHQISVVAISLQKYTHKNIDIFFFCIDPIPRSYSDSRWLTAPSNKIYISHKQRTSESKTILYTIPNSKYFAILRFCSIQSIDVGTWYTDIQTDPTEQTTTKNRPAKFNQIPGNCSDLPRQILFSSHKKSHPRY